MMRKLMLTLVLLIGVPTSAAQGQDQEAMAILQRAMRAVGGGRNLDRLKSPMMWMERGTFYGMGEGQRFVAQYAAEWPNWFRQEIENAFIITVTGEQAWVSNAAGVMEFSGAQLDEQLKQVRLSWAARLFPLTDKAYRLSKIDGIEVGGRETVGILARREEDRDV